jgi:alcohol dehydrogenase class IV
MTTKFDEAFVYNGVPNRVVFGSGTISRLAEEVKRLGLKRPLVLSTPVQKRDAEMIAVQLGENVAGIYTNATMHTPVDVTEAAVAVMTETKADGVIAFGGGSTTGLGKAIALRTDLPQIVLPTTYAGSEMTNILGETYGGQKKTLRSPKVQPEVIIYDVDFTLTLPVGLSATSGMNAIAHAVEGLYAQDRNPIISLMALEGIRALAEGLPVIVERPQDRTARSKALYGAWLCGTVLGSVSMALHHKLCHVLGGTFDLPHAETHTVVLPHATSFNAEAVGDLLAPLNEIFNSAGPGQGLYDFAKRIGAPTALKDLKMPEDGLDKASTLATENPYYNPRPFDRQQIRSLLDDAFHGRRPQK